jgi:hypothetical protein
LGGCARRILANLHGGLARACTGLQVIVADSRSLTPGIQVDSLRVGQGPRDLVLATARVGFVRRFPAVSCGTWTPLMLHAAHPGLPNPALVQGDRSGFVRFCLARACRIAYRVHAGSHGSHWWFGFQIRHLPRVPKVGWWACAVSLGVLQLHTVGFGSPSLRGRAEQSHPKPPGGRS